LKIALFYFSGTGNTEKIGEVIASELAESNAKVDVFNITSYKERQKNHDFSPYDAIILGFPIYAWRAPKVVREWLKSLDGQKKQCATFFTYGGVAVGSAHYDIKEILDESHFILIGTSEFPGRHTFNLAGWDFLENRPDKYDFEIAKEFARNILKKFRQEEINRIKIENPMISQKLLERFESREKTLPKPSRRGRECSMCRICEDVCPSMAMNADTGEPDNSKCLRCLRCIINCPDNVLEIEDMRKLSEFILNANDLTKDELERRTSKIYC
jgi:flavodoxin/Fe-S-cluster-containing hydrogenase component 2